VRLEIGIAKRLAVGWIIATCLQCGQGKQAQNPSPTTPAVGAAQHIPAGWDGSADWSGSTLQVLEE
jgi:hypothetical protein